MKQGLCVLLMMCVISISFAQEEAMAEVDSVTPKSQRIKIDGVAAVVGDYIILESDIDKTIIDLKQQGVSTKDFTRCKLLGKLMEDKLYAHQAIQDSIEVSQGEVSDRVNQTLDYFVQQLGGIEKVLKFYNKEDEVSLRNEIGENIKINLLAQRMQSKVVEDVEITPEEVRQFFDKIPEDERPVFGVELEIAQILIEPKASEEEVQKVINKLKDMKRDIEENGSSFGTKAILYSQGPSRKSGGFMAVNRKSPLVKEFKDVVFALQEGEISDPFETEYGWHIATVDKIRGQEVDLRHILLVPQVTDAALNEARQEIDSIRTRIVDGELTFDQAAREFSDEKETRNNGGVLINPATLDTRFDLTKIDPDLYGQVQNLKGDEVSLPLIDETRTGQRRFKLIKVTNRFEEHKADYSQDYIKIKNLALKEKQLKVIQDWITERIESTYINVNTANQGCDFANNWLKK